MRINYTKVGCLVFTVLLFFTLCASNSAWANPLFLVFEDAEYRDIFKTIGEHGELNVFIDDSVVGQGSVKISNSTIPEALKLVSELSGYAYRLSEDTLIVGTKERLAEYEKGEIRYIHTRYVSPQSVIPALSMVVGNEQIYAHPDSNLLVLSGTQAVLDEAEKIVAELDQPSKLTLQEQRTILSILQQVTEELHLDLIADPKLADQSIIMNAWQMDPWQILEFVEDLAMLDIKVQEQTVIASQKDSEAKEKIKVYRLNHMEPEATASAISLVLPEDRIQVDETSRSVMIKASEVQIAQVDSFIADYDQPLPQVFMEVWIQEMSADALQSLGVEWSTDFNGFITENQDSDSPNFFEINLEPWEISFALKALEDEGKARVLASPKLATLSGQEATIFVGDRVPVVLVDDEGREQLEFLESGISLEVLPKVADDGFITINVRPEVSTFSFTSGSSYPQIRTREAETNIRVKDGQPVLIGGLLQEQESEIVKKVPVLGYLPLVGKLFTSTTIETEQTEMNIFLIPRIVDGSEGLISDTFYAEDARVRSKLNQNSKPKAFQFWVASYYPYASNLQLQAGLAAQIKSIGLGLGIQYVNEDFNLVTDLTAYSDSGGNVRLEFNIPIESFKVPFSFNLAEIGMGLGFGLPIDYQGLTIEPSIGLYKLDEEITGRFGIRLLK